MGAAVSLSLLSLACSDGARPEYTRVEGVAPNVVPVQGATLVVFWASWCPPCREEMPGLRALARDPPVSLSILTFGEDDDEAPAREFFGGAPPPELAYRHDVERRASLAFGATALPAAYLVVDGRLVARFSGARDWNSRAMRRLLGRLASEDPPSAPGRGKPGIDVPRVDR